MIPMTKMPKHWDEDERRQKKRTVASNPARDSQR